MSFDLPLGPYSFGEFEDEPTGPTPSAVYDSILPIVAQVYEPSSATLQIQAIVEYPYYDSVLPVRAEVFELSSATLPVLAQVYGDITGAWRPVVMLGGVDVSAKVVGDIRIRFAEGESATASFMLRPDTGVLDFAGWIKAQVTVDHLDNGSQVRKYTGEVAQRTYTPHQGLIEFECTTDMQTKLEASTRAQIDALTPGAAYSADVSEDSGDNWHYAQERMRTLPGSLWTDRSGAVRYTPWAAKATPDLVLQAGDIKGGTLTIKGASSRSMINRVRIGLDYRYFNLRQRDVSFHLKPPQFCEILTKNFKLPRKEQIRQAAEGTGWTLQDINYVELPPEDFYECNGDQIGFVDATGGTACMGASFTLSKRWAQRVTEDYLLDVRADDSIAAIGEMGVVESHGIQSDYDISDWEQSDKYTGDGAAIYSHPGGSGDKVGEADLERRAEMELALQVLLAAADVEILGTHRGTEVGAGLKLRHDLDLDYTIEIQHPKVDVRAKAAVIEEIISVRTGSVIPTITLAVSRHEGAGGGSASPLDQPERPDATQEPEAERNVHLGFRIGPIDAIPYAGLSGIKALTGDLNLGEDQFNGYSTNDKNAAPDPTKVAVPEGMTVITPVIDGPYVEATVLQKEQVYQVVIPQDLFVVRH
ncbi:MAG: hypothetical protein KDI55_02495 [Anaerolineae bacterium]|nr:hypothetical protein [Anaerolineae bacterium]